MKKFLLASAALALSGLLLYTWLHFHDAQIRHEYRDRQTTDSLARARKESKMLRDSLKVVQQARTDSIAVQARQQQILYRKSQETRVSANKQIIDLKRLVRDLSTDTASAGEILSGLHEVDSTYNQALALKDSVIASRDQSILLYQRILSDKDQSILRLNQDLKAAVDDANKWQKKAGEGRGVLDQAARYGVRALAAYGAFALATGR